MANCEHLGLYLTLCVNDTAMIGDTQVCNENTSNCQLLLISALYASFLQRVSIARNAERCAVLARGNLSVCLSVRHVPVLCPGE